MIMDTEEMQGSKLGLYVKALEKERQKIQVFQRELPLCLELVTQAIERCKQELSDNDSIEYRHRQSECSEQTSSEGHVFEEFIPLKRSSSSDSDNDEELEESDHHRIKNNNKDKNSGDKKKSDWLRSVQLWNTTPDLPQKEELPRKALVVEVKRNGDGFQPFQKEKGIGKTNGAVVKSPAAPSTSSTSDTVNGGSGGGNTKKEDKEGQRKQRRNWSPELHRRFLHALQQLGGSHTATPKQIRELMKVDGLTNDEVKSHLQKYRLHTRRPTPTIHNNNNNNNNAQAPQFVVVGGIWVPPQDYNAAVAAANTASGEAARVAAGANVIYAPVASTPSTVPQVSPSVMHRPRSKKPEPSSHSEERASHSGEGRGHSNSTATSPSSTHNPASPPAY